MPAVVIFPPLNGANNTTVATITQFKQALSAADPSGLVRNNLPADETSSVAIAWTQETVPISGALYNFVQSKLGYTSAQMGTLYQQALQYPATV